MIDAAGLVWHRSSRCSNATCIEVAKLGDDYLIRDSKNPAAPPLRFPAAVWHQFLADVREGRLE